MLPSGLFPGCRAKCRERGQAHPPLKSLGSWHRPSGQGRCPRTAFAQIGQECWTGALRSGISLWAMVLGALPALGHWSTSLVWEAVREGTWAGRAHGQGRHCLALSLWLLGPVVTSEYLQPGLGTRVRAKEERYRSTCGLETQTHYPFLAPFCSVT